MANGNGNGNKKGDGSPIIESAVLRLSSSAFNDVTRKGQGKKEDLLTDYLQKAADDIVSQGGTAEVDRRAIRVNVSNIPESVLEGVVRRHKGFGIKQVDYVKVPGETVEGVRAKYEAERARVTKAETSLDEEAGMNRLFVDENIKLEKRNKELELQLAAANGRLANLEALVDPTNQPKQDAAVDALVFAQAANLADTIKDAKAQQHQDEIEARDTHIKRLEERLEKIEPLVGEAKDALARLDEAQKELAEIKPRIDAYEAERPELLEAKKRWDENQQMKQRKVDLLDQAKAAADAARVKAETKEREYDEKLGNYRKTIQENQRLHDEKIALQRKIAQITHEREDLRISLERRIRELEPQAQRVNEAPAELANAQEELGRTRRKLTELEQERPHLLADRQELKQIKDGYDQTRQEIDAAFAEAERRQKEADRVKAECEGRQSVYCNASSELERIKRELTEMQRARDGAVRTSAEAQRKLKEAEEARGAQVGNFLQEKAQLQQEARKATEAQTALNERVTAAERTVAEKKAEVERMSGELRNTARELDEKKKLLEEQKTKLGELRAENPLADPRQERYVTIVRIRAKGSDMHAIRRLYDLAERLERTYDGGKNLARTEVIQVDGVYELRAEFTPGKVTKPQFSGNVSSSNFTVYYENTFLVSRLLELASTDTSVRAIAEATSKAEAELETLRKEAEEAAARAETAEEQVRKYTDEIATLNKENADLLRTVDKLRKVKIQGTLRGLASDLAQLVDVDDDTTEEADQPSRPLATGDTRAEPYQAPALQITDGQKYVPTPAFLEQIKDRYVLADDVVATVIGSHPVSDEDRQRLYSIIQPQNEDVLEDGEEGVFVYLPNLAEEIRKKHLFVTDNAGVVITEQPSVLVDEYIKEERENRPQATKVMLLNERLKDDDKPAYTRKLRGSDVIVLVRGSKIVSEEYAHWARTPRRS